jgi:hypothetical protein
MEVGGTALIRGIAQSIGPVLAHGKVDMMTKPWPILTLSVACLLWLVCPGLAHGEVPAGARIGYLVDVGPFPMHYISGPAPVNWKEGQYPVDWGLRAGIEEKIAGAIESSGHVAVFSGFVGFWP